MKILQDKKQWFRCLFMEHIPKNYKLSHKCYYCQGKKHQISICENSINIDDKKGSKSQKPADNGKK